MISRPSGLLRWPAIAAASTLSAAALCAGGLTLAPAAHAHTSVESTNPAPGAALAAVPSEIVLTFTEPLKPPATVVVTAPDGTALVSGAPVIDDVTVTQKLKPTTATGTFTYAYRAFSADGHQVRGNVTFTVGEPSAAVAPSATPGASASPSPDTSGEASDDSAGGSGVTDDGFWAERWWQVAVGVGLFAIAGALEFAARRTRRG